jgi:hypothetical protein
MTPLGSEQPLVCKAFHILHLSGRGEMASIFNHLIWKYIAA